VLDGKLTRLRELIESYGSCLVAYSGGVDSVFLAHVAHKCLGARSLAVIADSPSLPRRELEDAIDIARQFDIPLRVVHTAEFSNAQYLANPVNRCYFCKNALFTELLPLAKSLNLATVVYGENASDVGDHRPGARAADEFMVRAPLKEAGLTKTDIRELSATMGLPTADKPQMACLSSRIPTSERVTVEKLRMIEESEYFLRDLGFHDVRVRHHELGQSANDASVAGGYLARIEIGSAEFPKLLADFLFQKIADRFRAIGYAHVTLDLAGYRRGSTNGVSQPKLGASPIVFHRS
jgi:uncharacterized protein